VSIVLVPLAVHEGTQAPSTAAPTYGAPVIEKKGARGSSLMQALSVLGVGSR